MPTWDLISLAIVIAAVVFQYFHLERLHRAEMDSICKWGKTMRKSAGASTGVLVVMLLIMFALAGLVAYFGYLTSHGWMAPTVFIGSVICLLGLLVMIAIMFVRDLRIKRGK